MKPIGRDTAHDLNNLLTAIIGAADAILDRSGIDPETRADVAQIREGARRGGALLRPDAPGCISVNETIRATARLLAHRLGTGIALTLDLTEADGTARMQAADLDRTLLNLIVNAGRAMPAGGTVSLRTRRQAVTATETHMPDAIPPGDYMVIAVADTGCGIPPDRLPHVFDTGVTSWAGGGGSGLGLASVRDSVRRADGFVAISSEVGTGTCFQIYLPLATGVAEVAALPDPPIAAGGRTVLLVDDDRFVRQVTERMLRRTGWHVLCADSAEAALTLLENTRCDLMISDVAMPGMDGHALARQVLERRPDFPVILISGYERTAPADQSHIARVTFLAKPYGQADLLAAVARVTPCVTPR